MASEEELKLNDLWKILSGKDRYLDELITQQKTEKLNQILSEAIGLSLTFGNLPEIITPLPENEVWDRRLIGIIEWI